MTEEEHFLELWKKEEHLYLSWGRFIHEKIDSLLSERIKPTPLDVFLRVPVKPRVKAQSSMLQKAFYRQKGYSDPYREIEDKVGLRYVVLLSYDVRTIEHAILDGTEFWEADVARDYKKELESKPEQFGYQSLHYVLYAKSGNVFDETEVPAGTPCEVQIRTLLQHAYSELTHDTLYKPSVAATPAMKRAAAKSMALIEATDDYFTQVSELIAAANARSEDIEKTLGDIYFEYVGDNLTKSPLNDILIDFFKKFSSERIGSDIREFIRERPYIIERIKERQFSSELYRQSAVILAYYSIFSHPQSAKIDCPIEDAELSLIYSDMGLSLHTNS